MSETYRRINTHRSNDVRSRSNVLLVLLVPFVLSVLSVLFDRPAFKPAGEMGPLDGSFGLVLQTTLIWLIGLAYECTLDVALDLSSNPTGRFVSVVMLGIYLTAAARFPLPVLHQQANTGG